MALQYLMKHAFDELSLFVRRDVFFSPIAFGLDGHRVRF